MRENMLLYASTHVYGHLNLQRNLSMNGVLLFLILVYKIRNHYQIYASWIPAFFRDVFLFGILNTTSTKHTSLML
jgi:hypothetical protein